MALQTADLEIGQWRRKAEGIHRTGDNLELEIGKVPIAEGVESTAPRNHVELHHRLESVPKTGRLRPEREQRQTVRGLEH